MILKDFIENYVMSNSLIRLHYKTKGGYISVGVDSNDVSMEHEIINGKGKFGKYKNYKVLGVKDILCEGHYTEAINIIIIEDDFRQQKLKRILNASK
jgi:hypothetical protein